MLPQSTLAPVQSSTIKTFVFMVWVEPQTYGLASGESWSQKMKNHFLDNHRYVTSLENLPVKLREIGFINQDQEISLGENLKRFCVIHAEKLIADKAAKAAADSNNTKAVNSAAQSTKNGLRVARLIADSLKFLGLDVKREEVFGESIIGSEYAWDVIVSENNFKIYLEIKHQGSKGSIEQKVIYTINSIKAICDKHNLDN